MFARQALYQLSCLLQPTNSLFDKSSSKNTVSLVHTWFWTWLSLSVPQGASEKNMQNRVVSHFIGWGYCFVFCSKLKLLSCLKWGSI